MAASVRFDAAALAAILTGRDGPVVRDLLRRGNRVASRAKALCPVDSGRLRSSIKVELRGSGPGIYVTVGTNVEYARAVHDGTGIYGPKGRPIFPVRAKVLRFTPKGEKSAIFRPSVKGVRPRPFLRNALPAARD